MKIRILYKIATEMAAALDTGAMEYDVSPKVPEYTRGHVGLKIKNKPINTPVEDDKVMWGEKTNIDQANTEAVAFPGAQSSPWPIESAW
ncbi:MAG: hypothetical protein ABIM30_00455 [candidate division WOR-3 bacterium]